MNIPTWLRLRLRRALDALPPDKQACARAVFKLSHRHAVAELATAGALPPVLQDLNLAVLARAALHPADEAQLESMAETLPFVAGGGELWGLGVYEQLDAGWLTAVIAWMVYSGRTYAPFPTQPQTIRIPNETTIALLGDWGAGDASPAGLRVGRAVKSKNPDYTIHLGDVYYFGGLLRWERTRLVDIWPGAPGTSFALNSNHEMYAGAHGYFEVALGRKRATPFTAQKGTSYFALENDHWVIVGLDSAYPSTWCALYMDGRLDDAQMTFLEEQVRKDKRVVVLTHHHGLSVDGTEETQLWRQIVSLLSRGGHWYWGHVHAGVVYAPRPGAAPGTTIHPRCAGHGSIPQGRPSALDIHRSGASPTVTWFQDTPAPGGGLRVLNGFAILSLDGDQMTEQFFDENGHPTYPPAPPALEAQAQRP